MGLGLLSPRLTALSIKAAALIELFGISQAFAWLSPAKRRIIQVLLTRAPLYSYCYFHVRLACLRHAASVHSEPESNSLIQRKICYVSELLSKFVRKFISPALASAHKARPFKLQGPLLLKMHLEFGSTMNRFSCISGCCSLKSKQLLPIT
jgi:hypothetical protein